MSKIQQLIDNYERRVNTPWETDISSRERIWFVIYNKDKERLIRYRVSRFQEITQKAGKKWFHIDITDSFAEWLTDHEYCENYFENPESIDFSLKKYRNFLSEKINDQLRREEVDEDSVFAVVGVGALFGFLRVHQLINDIRDNISGRLVIFFPGSFENNTYRLLDARDGWDYRAVRITNEQGVV